MPKDTDNKVLIDEKESNGCKVKVFCTKEKQKNCKDNILFYLLDSYEKKVLSDVMGAAG
ncbi:MAG: hypothetical protein J5964_01020 [Eubacterium sp.]|nr:hypothetical protein [Eubacterium sp.]